jgi:ferredoxin
MLSGVYKNSFEVGAVADSEDTLPDYNFGGAFNIALEKITQHQGQVLPLEDALRVIDLLPGDRFLLMHCACRRHFGHKDVFSCLFFDPVVDRALEQRPWETDSKVITREEAKDFEREMDRLGLVHSLWDSGVDADGKPPIVMCHCLETDCMPTRMRAHFGIVNAQRKGEYVAVVERGKCAEGCAKMPLCLPRCPFGALRYSPLDTIASVNISRCFGCGLCRPVCPTGAIRLVDRTTYPALVDEW